MNTETQVSEDQNILKCEECASTEWVWNDFRYPVGDDVNHTYCLKCAADNGFCLGCHHFCAGTDDYDFSSIEGFCGECADELRYEAGEYDDEYDDYY